MSEPRPDSADFDRLGDLLGEAGPRPASPQPGSAQRLPPPVLSPGLKETPSSAVQGGPAPCAEKPGPRPSGGRAPSSGRGVGRSPRQQEPGQVAPGDMARRIAEVWAEAVGPEITANARPVQLRQGRLVVSTSSSAWAQSLQFMGEAVRSRLNESLQTDEIRTVFFRHAGWEAVPDQGHTAPPARAPSRLSDREASCVRERDICGESGAMQGAGNIDDGPRREGSAADGDPQDLTEEQRAALEGVRDLEVSPELREVIGRAMKAAFVREERQ